MNDFNPIKRARMEKIERIMVRANQLAKRAASHLLRYNQYPTLREMLYLGQEVPGLPPRVKSWVRRADRLRDEVTLGFMQLAKLVSKEIAIQYNLSPDQRDDLVSQGWLILARAFINYANSDACFFTYARQVLRQELKRYVNCNNTSRLTSRSSEYATLAEKVRKVEEELTKAGITPTPEAIEQQVANEVKVANVITKIRAICQPFVAFSESDRVADHTLLLDPKLIKVQSEDQLPDSVDELLRTARITTREKTLLLQQAAGRATKELAEDHNMTLRQVQTMFRKARARISEELLKREAA